MTYSGSDTTDEGFTSQSIMAVERYQERSQLRMALREVVKNRMALAGVFMLGTFVLLAMSAGRLPIADPTAVDTMMRTQSPGWHHLLGTDSLGRDVLSRVIYGSRISLLVGLSSVAMAATIGCVLGLLAGYSGGRWDIVTMRAMDGILSFPPLLLALVIMGALGPSTTNVTLTLGFVYTPVFVRLVRASVLSEKELEYVIAARCLGARPIRVTCRHIFPNVLSPLTVQATATFSLAVIAEATLSFLGAGTRPPNPSWGLMMAEGQRYITQAYWLILAPAAAITLSVLGINFLGDGLRDALDPQSRLQ